MILLDTNVLSALMQQAPDAQVVAWLDDQPADSIWLSSITLFEARYGLALLPDGQRKNALAQGLKPSFTMTCNIACYFLTSTQHNRLPSWPQTEKPEAAPLTCVTPSLPASPWRSVPPLPHEM